jgi:hypothetical protein
LLNNGQVLVAGGLHEESICNYLQR